MNYKIVIFLLVQATLRFDLVLGGGDTMMDSGNMNHVPPSSSEDVDIVLIPSPVEQNLGSGNGE